MLVKAPATFLHSWTPCMRFRPPSPLQQKTSGVHTHPAGRNVQCAQVRLPNKKVEEKAMRPGFAFYNEEQRVTYAEYKLYT